jgi:uncharacterized protein YhfF
MSDNHDLLVFLEGETEAILAKLGLLQQVANGQIKCAVCSKTITVDNLGAVFEEKGQILLVCDDLKCLERMKEIRRDT